MHGPTGATTGEPATQAHRRCLDRRLPKIKAQPRMDPGLVPATHSRPTSQPCPHGGQNGASCYCTSGAGPSTPPPPKFAPVSSKQLSPPHPAKPVSSASSTSSPCKDVAHSSSASCLTRIICLALLSSQTMQTNACCLQPVFTPLRKRCSCPSNDPFTWLDSGRCPQRRASLIPTRLCGQADLPLPLAQGRANCAKSRQLQEQKC